MRDAAAAVCMNAYPTRELLIRHQRLRHKDQLRKVQNPARRVRFNPTLDVATFLAKDAVPVMARGGSDLLAGDGGATQQAPKSEPLPPVATQMPMPPGSSMKLPRQLPPPPVPAAPSSTNVLGFSFEKKKEFGFGFGPGPDGPGPGFVTLKPPRNESGSAHFRKSAAPSTASSPSAAATNRVPSGGPLAFSGGGRVLYTGVQQPGKFGGSARPMPGAGSGAGKPPTSVSGLFGHRRGFWAME